MKNIDTIKTRQDALGRAFELEKAALGYYRAMEEVLGQSEILTSIIDAEKQHTLKVMEYLFTGAEFRGIRDEGP